jgi:hypothetical protein
MLAENDVVFGIYDSYLNHPRSEFDIKAHPEIILFPRNKKDELIQYDLTKDNLNEKSMGDWLNRQLSKIQSQRIGESDL